MVGGLIGAFELTADHMFLDKAVECVNLMLPVFQTSSTGKSCVQQHVCVRIEESSLIAILAGHEVMNTQCLTAYNGGSLTNAS